MISTTLDNLMVEEEEESGAGTVNALADASNEESNAAATTTSSTTTSTSSSSTTDASSTVDAALKEMMAMGYSNDGGWLEQLLKTKNGNIEETLKTLGKMEKPKDEKKTE